MIPKQDDWDIGPPVTWRVGTKRKLEPVDWCCYAMIPACALGFAGGLYEGDLIEALWPVNCMVWVFIAFVRGRRA